MDTYGDLIEEGTPKLEFFNQPIPTTISGEPFMNPDFTNNKSFKIINKILLKYSEEYNSNELKKLKLILELIYRSVPIVNKTDLLMYTKSLLSTNKK